MNTKIIENLEKAIAIITVIPASSIDLEEYKTACGTHACAAGWLASDPFFQAQGMILTQSLATDGYSLEQDVLPSGYDGSLRWLNSLFGDAAFARLFNMRDYGDNDWYLNPDNILTDKGLALARLNEQLNRYRLLRDSE